MKGKLGNLLKTVIFLILFFSCLFAVSLVVERKSSYEKNEMFVREAKKNHIDAFIIGSSHVINGINPIELYEDLGVTAYNLGGYGSVLMSSYWQMKLALDYCKPKVVFVDAYMLENDIRYIDDPNANVTSDELHLNIDRFPLGKTKVQAINDMIEDKDIKMQYLFDFIVYHDRWKEITSDDVKRLSGTSKINTLMGADMLYNIHGYDFEYTDLDTGGLPGETVGTTYLRRIIEECKAQGIEVVVMTLPFLAMEENQQAAKTAEQIADEYGVYSINMLDMEGLVDYDMDFKDAGHLNVIGADKVTKCLENFIAENLDLPDHRDDPEYQVWQSCADEYYDNMKKMLTGNEDIYTSGLYMQLLQNKQTFAISIKGGSKSFYDTVFMKELKAMGAGEVLDRAIETKAPYIFISDKGNVTEFAGEMDLQTVSTSKGDLSYGAGGDIYRMLYINDDFETNYLYSDAYAYTDVQMLFFKKGQVKAHQYYNCDKFTYDYLSD
ncbi:hypothetical protein [Butyrivibrio sp. NC2002]|uniref:hypothetical protein n=1 Tax=Butyrivibrio sp. NC2002 TaxID=1410610 RepID=UPI00055BFA01|nr:hypothetical protein [Butyrivibrio sp. NC2002]